MAVKRLLLLLVAAVACSLLLVSAAPGGDFEDQPCSNIGGELYRCPDATQGESYTLALKLKETEVCQVFTISSGSFPPGLSIQPSTGVISGTPTQSGTYDFYVTVSYPDNGKGCLKNSSDRQFRIIVKPPVPKLTLGPEQDGVPPATVGSAYTLAMTATVPDPKSWTVTGTLPPGLTLGPTDGVISGTPTTAGAYGFTVAAVLVTDPLKTPPRSDTKGLTITVRDPLAITAPKPFAVTPAPTLWEVGVPFSSKLAVTGGNGTYTFSIASGTLPTGFTLAADGTVAGTTRTVGVSRATLRVADGEGRTSDYAANFGVAARLAVATLALKPGRVGKLYRARVTSTGGIQPRVWKIAKGPLPKGVRFDRRLGVLSGTPTKAGRYRVTFQVTDGLKVVAKKTLRIIVLP
jgi:hypothetical protein